MFSQYWKHISTPMFVISNQLDQDDFERITCNVTDEDEDFFTYDALWKQGVMTMIQVMSLQQPANGWFIPNCQDQVLFFSDEAIEQRKNVQVPLFVNAKEQNVLQVLNNWLTKDLEDDQYQAIDQLGLPNQACSSDLQSQRSQPLKKKGKDGKKSAKQRIVPLDPLADVPEPKGFPDGPPPKPSDPIDNVFLDGNEIFNMGLTLTKYPFFSDPFSNDRLLGQNLFGLGRKNSNNRQKSNKDKVNIRDLLPKGASDAEIVLGAELLRRQMAEQQRRLRPSNNQGSITNDEYYKEYDNNDYLYYDTLYRL